MVSAAESSRGDEYSIPAQPEQTFTFQEVCQISADFGCSGSRCLAGDVSTVVYSSLHI